MWTSVFIVCAMVLVLAASASANNGTAPVDGTAPGNRTVRAASDTAPANSTARSAPAGGKSFHIAKTLLSTR